MRNFFIFLAIFIVGTKYGIDYLFSDKFEAYCDRTKAPWTCQFDNSVGYMYNLMSNYDSSEIYFEKTVKRCPDTEMAQAAEFEIANALESTGHLREAVVAYDAFAEKYKGTKRARDAAKSATMIHLS